jgi:nucleoside-diphosphate-sugar epimerase
VVPTFITRALAGQPLPVFGSGGQTRSFCYVTDLVEGLMRLMESSYEGPVNLGSTDEVTVLDLAREIIERAESSSRIEFAPRPVDDPTRRRPDLATAARVLLWQPQVSRMEGLGRTVDHYRTEEKST